MLTSIASLRPLKQVAFALLACDFAAPPTPYDQCNPNPEAVDYVATEVYSQALTIAAYWKTKSSGWIGIRPWCHHLNSRFYGPKDQELLVTCSARRASAEFVNVRFAFSPAT